MNVNVFDTHVRTGDGRYLHFDVLTDNRDVDQAGVYAAEWLTSRGIQAADISQSRCQFCHSEFASPAVAEAIEKQGYFILPLEGCQE
ncbi:MAG: DUF2024 family protein [Pseudomonas sp.]|uniref:DUF2024 family protein n=1 Tax=Pseudomonas sp. TaxID=306 RepID=UPI003D0D9A0D